jgi:hypothetical protein
VTGVVIKMSSGISWREENEQNALFVQ